MARWDFSIYLIKRENEKSGLTINPLAESKVRHYLIPLDSGEKWSVFVKRIQENSPPWVRFFRGHLDEEKFGKSRSPAAVLFVPAAGRLFALVFGTSGHGFLYPGSWENRFGFKVTINAIDHERIRSIDRDRLESEPRRGRELASRDRNAGYFGVDPILDIVQSMTGSPGKRISKNVGKTLSGKDHLRVVRVSTSLPELPALLSRYFSYYQSSAYRVHFPWVDHIAEVTDKEMAADLDAELIDTLNKRKLDKCSLAVPEMVDWGDIRGFKFSHTRRRVVRNELLIDFLIDTFSESIDLESLGRRTVTLVDMNGEKITTWHAYQCILAEVERENKTYILNTGTWFKIASDFVAGVNQSVKTIPRMKAGFLGPYSSKDKSETAFNLRISDESSGRLALMDCKRIFCPTAPSPIEFCDLYDREKGELIHVKRYGGSSVLSHLFFQGLNSAEAYLKDPGFRLEVNKELPISHRLADPEGSIKPEEYRVVFAIIYGKDGPLSLPFFSRLSLRHAVERLRLLRFNIALAKVEMTENARKLGRPSGTRIVKTF